MSFIRILTWLYMIYDYKQSVSGSGCNPPKNLHCFFYLSSHKKQFPINNRSLNQSPNILSEINANTAFTSTCAMNVNEIVIFRMEEWFKVFIHETIHTFGLDFSDMSGLILEQTKMKMLDIFKVKSDVNLYEAYTEFWAEIINIMFCSLYVNKIERYNILFPSKTEFYDNTIKLLNLESIFSIIQMNSILHFMDLNYEDLYNSKTSRLREKYKERTNILSYYVIKNILLTHSNDFFDWILNNNVGAHNFLSFVYFKKTKKYMNDFCHFILAYHKDMPLNMTPHSFNTMRMSCCELNSF
jgi:hypothetical protein